MAAHLLHLVHIYCALWAKWSKAQMHFLHKQNTDSPMFMIVFCGVWRRTGKMQTTFYCVQIWPMAEELFYQSVLLRDRFETTHHGNNKDLLAIVKLGTEKSFFRQFYCLWVEISLKDVYTVLYTSLWWIKSLADLFRMVFNGTSFL